MKIASLNIDRRASSLIKLNFLATNHKIDIIMIQDFCSLLNPIRRKLIMNTTLSAFDPILGGRNETLCTLVNKNLETISIDDLTSEPNISCLGTKIKSDKEIMTLVNIYIRPKATAAQLNKCLELIEEYIKDNKANTIIAGDFNATSPLWDSDNILNSECSDLHYYNIKINRGKRIEDFIFRQSLWCTNNNSETTYQNNDNKSVIDLILTGPKIGSKIKCIQTFRLNKNGHKLIMATIESPVDTVTTVKTHRTHLIKQEHFIALHILHRKLSNNWRNCRKQLIINRLETLCSSLYQTIINIQTSIERIKHIRNTEIRFNNHTKKLIKSLEKLETKAKRERKSSSRSKLAKTNTRRKIHKTRQRIFNTILGNQTSSGDLWSRYNKCNTLLDHNEKTHDNELLDQTMIEQIANEKFPNDDTIPATTSYSDISQSLTNIEISQNEVEAAIYRLRKKNFTGPEGIKFSVFLKSLEFINEIIVTICKMSFKAAHIPKICQTTTGILIPKKEKGKFRIVHVGTPMSSLLEQIALVRLEFRLEKNNLINRRQYGFVALRGRHDLITRLIENVVTYRNIKKNRAATTIVSLDIDGAFDNVDQSLLIEKLRKDLLYSDDIHLWLEKFISNRYIKLKYGQIESQTKRIRKGVPQGSPLGPILWNYTINQIDTNINDLGTTELLAYADDLFLIYNGLNKTRIQSDLKTLVWNVSRLNLKFKPSKCSLMTICSWQKRETSRNTYDIYIYDEKISIVESMNILGVTITDRLKLDRKALTTIRNLKENIAKLDLIRQWGTIKNSTEWRSLIHSLILSITVDNNFPILALDTTSTIWMDSLITKSLKRTFGWPNQVSNKLTRLITRIPHTKVLIRKQITNRLGTEHHNSYALLLDLLAGENDDLKDDRNYTHSKLTELDNYYLAHPYDTRFGNPKHILEAKSVEIELYDRPTWVIIEETNKQTTLALTIEPLIALSLLTNEHPDIKRAYFNSLDAIKKLTTIKSNKEKRLALRPGSSILAALLNNSTHNSRILNLRESLQEQGWSIVIMSNSRITTKLMNITQANNPERPTHSRMSTQTCTKRLESLPFHDYMIRSRQSKINQLLERTYFENCQTQVSQTICTDTEIWALNNPAWINSSKMLMLTGLVQKSNGHLQFGRKDQQSLQHIGCESTACETLPNNRTTAIKHNIARIHTSTEATIHRGFNCNRNTNKQIELLNCIREANNLNNEDSELTAAQIIQTIAHRRFSQRFLRILTELAFPNHIR